MDMDKEIIFKTFFKIFTKFRIGFHFTLVITFFYTAQTLRINRAKVTIGFCFTLKRELPK